MSSWTPPTSDLGFVPDNDPTSMNYADLGIREALLAASPEAFAELESALSTTARLAAITAEGLGSAKAASWQGEAADQYRRSLQMLPVALHRASESYQAAYATAAAFADTTLELKGRYLAFQARLTALKGTYSSAVMSCYPDQASGQARITALQGQLNNLCADGFSILVQSNMAQESMRGKIITLIQAAPHEGPIAAVWQFIKGFGEDAIGTPGAIEKFANHPDWSTFSKMAGDISIDAAILIALAGFPELAAGLGWVDADGTLVEGLQAVRAAGQGALIAGNGGSMIADYAQGEGAEGALDELALLSGLDGAVVGDEIDQAVSDTKLLDSYEAALTSGDTAALSKEQLEQLQKLVPNYKTDPDAVPEATEEANKDLAIAAGLKNPYDFLKDNFGTGALEHAAAKALDGNGNGSGN
jgi:hypothetical protein